MKILWGYLLFLSLSLSLLPQDATNIILKDIKITPEFSISSQKNREWACLTGEVMTGRTWNACDIEIVVNVNYYGSHRNYSVPLHLPAESKKRFFVYIFFQGSYRDILVFITKEGRRIKEEHVQIPIKYANIFRIGYFPSQEGHNLFFLKQLQKYTPWTSGSYYAKRLEEIEIVHLQAPLLPDRWIGYSNMDVMVMSQEENLSRERKKAIQEWIYSGGILMIAPKERSWLYRSKFIQQLLGYSISKESLLYVPPSEKIRKHLPRVSELLAMTPPTNAILDQDLQKSLWFVYKGAGAILYLGLDAGQENANSPSFWKDYLLPKFYEILDRKDTWYFLTNSRNEREEEYKVAAALSLSFERMPGIWTILIFLFLYLILAGPVNFLYFRKKNLTLHLVWSIPVVSISFVLFLLIYGYGVRGVNSEALSLHLVQHFPGTEYACHQKYISLLSASHSIYNIHLEENGILYPLYSEWRAQEVPFLHYNEKEGLKIQDFPLTLWQTGNFSSIYFQENMPLSVEIEKTRIKMKKPSSLPLSHIFAFLNKENMYYLGNFSDDSIEKVFSIGFSSENYQFVNDIARLAGILEKYWQWNNKKMTQFIARNIIQEQSNAVIIALIEDRVYSPISLNPEPQVHNEMKIFYYKDTGIPYANK